MLLKVNVAQKSSYRDVIPFAALKNPFLKASRRGRRRVAASSTARI